MELVSLKATHRDGRASFQKIASIALHALVIVAITWQLQHQVPKVLPRPHRDAQVIVPYAPGHKAAVQPPPKRKIIPRKDPPKLAMKQPDPPSPPSSAADPTGEADVTVALADFYPDPKPDLSVLPHRTHSDVALDIVIDEEGKVVDTQVDSGLGHGH